MTIEIDDDKDYGDPEPHVIHQDFETGESFYRHPFTNQKIYIDESEEEAEDE